jgi:gluconate 5-dehydrogenase
MEGAGMFDLGGRLCVVTGGGRGIGRSIASALAAHGGRVVVTGRSEDTLKAAAEDIRAGGGEADWLTADMRSEDEVVRLARTVEERFGPAHVLVNNAGIDPTYKSVEKTSLDEWSAIIGTNLTGVFLACREFGRQMLAAGRGSVVNVGSVAGRTGLGRSAPYCASKGGVELMSKAMAIDWAMKGVRVNSVAPAFVKTDLTSQLLDHPVHGARIGDRTPMGRLGRTDEIAGAVVFLASDASALMTGSALVVDGGWTAE